jgi:hypothetical protein
MSFKLISIVFIPLAITHQSLCGQNMSLFTYTYLSQTYRARSVVIVLAVRFLRASQSSTRPLRVPLHVQLFALYCFCCLPICTRRILHSSSV